MKAFADYHGHSRTGVILEYHHDFSGTQTHLFQSSSIVLIQPSIEHHFKLASLKAGYTERLSGEQRESGRGVLDVGSGRHRIEVRLYRQLVELPSTPDDLEMGIQKDDLEERFKTVYLHAVEIRVQVVSALNVRIHPHG